jgi:hypothetical protein
MNKTITLELPIAIKTIISRLKLKDKIELVHILEKETRKSRWSILLNRINNRFKKNPVTENEINLMCKTIRQSSYEKTAKNSH